jgi:hypothetical protein
VELLAGKPVGQLGGGLFKKPGESEIPFKPVLWFAFVALVQGLNDAFELRAQERPP